MALTRKIVACLLVVALALVHVEAKGFPACEYPAGK
jgi:hypothetical protein